MMELNDWQNIIHNNLKDSYVETRKSHDELHALFHKKLDDAYNELLKDPTAKTHQSQSGKAQGFFIEMADLVIIILTHLYVYDQNAQELCELMNEVFEEELIDDLLNYKDFLLNTHKLISDSLESIKMGQLKRSYGILALVINYTSAFMELNNANLFEYIEITYNN